MKKANGIVKAQLHRYLQQECTHAFYVIQSAFRFETHVAFSVACMTWNQLPRGFMSRRQRIIDPLKLTAASISITKSKLYDF